MTMDMDNSVRIDCGCGGQEGGGAGESNGEIGTAIIEKKS